ncbi:G2E3 ligase, partial [Atlantisia rogersi]|nr:G2E3 ligase [Atlantisia rogersi]
VCAGIFCFVCPLCRDREGFQTEMFMMGIRVPARLPLWEGKHTYPAMNRRHSRCDASECVCPGGREQAENEGPWQLLLCCSCAAKGTHRFCSSLERTASSCAGPATGKRQSTWVPLGRGRGWQGLAAS